MSLARARSGGCGVRAPFGGRSYYGTARPDGRDWGVERESAYHYVSMLVTVRDCSADRQCVTAEAPLCATDHDPV